ncbi:hypothetical protein PVK06_006467 [Gossypium arboreum]|uniref:Uncharacterized protein n=1 Tax=Gossypium arboreum TaxID=29729 RepID=A0ABR0QET8_GOSAR|nr:hypothetical protein PVK06_006467 [Gossypium arboreum]
MPKKMSVYSKAEAARARKCATEADRKELEAREKEEQYFSPKQKRSSTGAKPRVRNPKPRLAVLRLLLSDHNMLLWAEMHLCPGMKIMAFAENVVSMTVKGLRKLAYCNFDAEAKPQRDSKQIKP